VPGLERVRKLPVIAEAHLKNPGQQRNIALGAEVVLIIIVLNLRNS